MSTQKPIVPLNDPKDALQIFRQTLLPSVVDVRGKRIEVDLGDYTHIFLDHPEMQSRTAWVKETLINPEEIRKHPDKSKSFREIYLNRIYTHNKDSQGTIHIVVVDIRPFPELWTSFVPRHDYFEMIQKRGKLIWSRKMHIK